MKLLLNLSAGLFLSTVIFLPPLQAMDKPDESRKPLVFAIIARDFGARLPDELADEGCLIPAVLKKRYVYSCNNEITPANENKYAALGRVYPRPLTPEEICFWKHHSAVANAHRRENNVKDGYDTWGPGSGWNLIKLFRAHEKTRDLQYMLYDTNISQKNEPESQQMLAYKRTASGIDEAEKNNADIIVVVESDKSSAVARLGKAQAKGICTFIFNENDRFPSTFTSLDQYIVDTVINDEEVQKKSNVLQKDQKDSRVKSSAMESSLTMDLWRYLWCFLEKDKPFGAQAIHANKNLYNLMFMRLHGVTIEPSNSTFSNEVISKITPKITHISTLTFYNSDLSNQALRRFTNLTDLSLQDNYSIDDETLSSLTKLTHLQLINAPNLTENALSGLTGLCSLEIVLEGDDLGNNTRICNALPHFKKLRSLYIEGVDLKASHVSTLPDLNDLTLVGSAMPIEDVRTLTHLLGLCLINYPSENIETLTKLTSFHSMAENNIERSPLSYLTNLRNLNMEADKKGISGLPNISGLKNLTCLSVGGFNFDDDAKTSILGFTQLKELNLCQTGSYPIDIEKKLEDQGTKIKFQY